MLPTTTTAIRSILTADPSVSVSDRRDLLARLREPANQPASVPTRPTEPRLLKRRAVAERLGRSTRTVDALCTRGVLTKVIAPGSTRALGIRASDLENLIESGGVA